MASIWHFFFPDQSLYAEHIVDYVLTVLQLAIIPNVFFNLLMAMILLSVAQMKRISWVFLKTILILWATVTVILFGIWWVMLDSSLTLLNVPAFSYENMGLSFALPLVICLSIILGVGVVSLPALHFLKPYIAFCQEKVVMLFDGVFVLLPVLVFFVVVNFLSNVGDSHIHWIFNYMGLSITFVSMFLLGVLPFLYWSLLSVGVKEYWQLVMPVVIMTILAGDSIAAIPLISRATDSFGSERDPKISQVLTLVVICFPWL